MSRGCLTPSSGFSCTEQPSALSTCNKKRLLMTLNQFCLNSATIFSCCQLLPSASTPTDDLPKPPWWGWQGWPRCLLPGVWQTPTALHPQGGQGVVGPPELLALQKSSGGWHELSCPAECRMSHKPYQTSVQWSARLWVSSQAVRLVKGHQLPHHKDLCHLSPGCWWLSQSTAMHSCSTCLGGRAAANLIREKW